MPKPKSQRLIERLVKLHRRWIQDTGEDVRHYAASSINRGLSDGSIHSLRNISSNLGGMATYWGVHGVVSLTDGNPSGWQQVHHSCLLHLWVLKIESALFQRLADSSSLTLFVPRVACTLCYSIACGLRDWRQKQANLLSMMASDTNMATADYWQERRFEPFMIRLNQILEGDTPALRSGDSFGVYTDILSHWNNEGSLAEALIRACDYHCENMDDTGDWDPEFDHAPFDLIPWEILAIQQVRQHNGLSMPRFTHALAAPSVMQVQMPSHVQDEFLPRVEQLFNQYFSA
jgi:hypothetical protein